MQPVPQKNLLTQMLNGMETEGGRMASPRKTTRHDCAPWHLLKAGDGIEDTSLSHTLQTLEAAFVLLKVAGHKCHLLLQELTRVCPI